MLQLSDSRASCCLFALGPPWSSFSCARNPLRCHLLAKFLRWYPSFLTVTCHSVWLVSVKLSDFDLTLSLYRSARLLVGVVLPNDHPVKCSFVGRLRAGALLVAEAPDLQDQEEDKEDEYN